ncbi:MAG: sulfite exporter TauE/SafE family protein [Gemmatimonadales bacterium]
MTVLGHGLALVVGLSLGLLGGGGSVLTVPIFVYVMGFEAKQSIAMSLIVVGAASLVGAVRHWHAGRVDLRVAISFGLVAMASSYGGARLAKFVSGPTQLVLLAIVVCAAAISMARSARPDPIGPAADDPVAAVRAPSALQLMPVAIGVGLLTGLVGVGGGFLIVPALVLLGRVPIKLAIGTSLLVIAMNCAAGIVGYLGHVTIPWEIVAVFTAVAISGLFAGSHLVGFVSPASLRRGFAVLLMCVGTFVLLQNWRVLASAASAGYSRASSWHPGKA